jgi:hypothetical protein
MTTAARLNVFLLAPICAWEHSIATRSLATDRFRSNRFWLIRCAAAVRVFIASKHHCLINSLAALPRARINHSFSRVCYSKRVSAQAIYFLKLCVRQSVGGETARACIRVLAYALESATILLLHRSPHIMLKVNKKPRGVKV